MMNIADRSQTVTDSKDMLAKLLASENITVVRGNLKTASFDTVNRVLRLPQWQNLTADVEEMLIGHEVGHALYTTNDYMDECAKDNALMGYMNVIEDVRIEKKIKAKYPGLRKTFTTAYRKLQADDFFQIANRDLSKLLLIDRINLYFKAGFTCGVKFSTEEAAFVRRVAECDSIHDVYKLATELLGYTRDELEEQKEEVMKMMSQQMTSDDIEDANDVDEYDEDFDPDMGDFEYGSGETDEDDADDESSEDPTPSEDEEGFGGNGGIEGGQNDKEDPIRDEAESVTERSLREKLSDLADTDRQYINVEFDGKKAFNYNPIITYKEILSFVDSDRNYGWTEFYNTVNRDVNYLVKEFEMRKQATRMKRATRAKTGDLAVNKLFAYKLTDDLFKRITVLPDGKNHGFIMLLDWSGSMHEHMGDTIKQCLTVSMFLRRIQVPFRVYAFTDSFRPNRFQEGEYDEYYAAQRKRQEFENDRRNSGKATFQMGMFNLLEFFSDRMSASDFTRMAKFMFSCPWQYTHTFGLGGTPLYEAMWWVADHCGDFIRSNSVERFSFITLTDGEGHPFYPNFQTRTRVERVSEDGERMTPRLVENMITLVDPKTRKTYEIKAGRYKDNFKSVLLNILKDRYGARCISFHITRNSARDVGGFFNTNCVLEGYSLEREKLFVKVREELRRSGFVASTDFGGDLTFILRADKMKIEEDANLSIDNTKHAASIAKTFSKHLGSNRSSKVMLNQFMELVA